MLEQGSQANIHLLMPDCGEKGAMTECIHKCLPSSTGRHVMDAHSFYETKCENIDKKVSTLKAIYSKTTRDRKI